MKYILFPHPDIIRPLPFYFAVEEYVARHYTDDDCFMVWRVNPTVMVGRNQLIDNEVDIDYCRTHGVDIFRRKSGGGCIYSDLGCLQFSYISSAENVSFAFTDYMQRVADLLQSLHIDATLSGRNDILVDGRKVAGSAFYAMKRRSVLHNSLLFDTRLDHLSQALTPSHEKLRSKGVASVSQRVNNIAPLTQLHIDDFMQYTRQYMCGEATLKLTHADMQAIALIRQELSAPGFVYGKNPKYTETRRRRLSGVGTIEAHIDLRNGNIVDLELMGDYFLLGDLDHDLIAPLRGIPFTREAVEERLADIEPGRVIRGLEPHALLRLLFGRRPHVMKPEWLKTQLTTRSKSGGTADILNRHRMNTICTEGMCPNRAECWAARTATLMIGGSICTRRCRFCNTPTGRPQALDADEPRRVAQTVKALALRYAVITSVDRDDLPDYGADHWVQTVTAIRALCPETRIELLIPDFMGREDLITKVTDTRPDVVGHNMETVRRLTPSVRSVACYDRSLEVLRIIAAQGMEAKTGFMVGLGESREEVETLMDDILATGCRRLTIGQYLQPTAAHLPVAAYIAPETFAEYKRTALAKGFSHVESGPLVRSSYHAEEAATDRMQDATPAP